MLLLIDNYDSFTYNLFHYLGELGADVRVVRNDEISAAEALGMKPEGIVLSPGPCTPNEAGICMDVIRQANGNVPILGVCLGHQAIGQANARRPAQSRANAPAIRQPGIGVPFAPLHAGPARRCRHAHPVAHQCHNLLQPGLSSGAQVENRARFRQRAGRSQ